MTLAPKIYSFSADLGKTGRTVKVEADPVGTRRAAPRLRRTPGRGWLLLRAPGLPFPVSRLWAYGTNSLRADDPPGPRFGLQGPRRPAEADEPGRGLAALRPRRRPAPPAQPAGSGARARGSPLEPPRGPVLAQPHARWVPAGWTGCSPSDTGTLARRRPKPGNHGER